MANVVPGALERLPWDSEHFGFGVARWQAGEPDETELQAARQRGLDLGIALVYLSLRPDHAAGEQALRAVGAALVDRKTNLAKPLDAAPVWPNEVVEFMGTSPTSALTELALASGIRSRYLVDPRMPRECFQTLYRLWIQRSVARQIADAVLVVPGSQVEEGLVTVKAEGDGVARIGLIAVDARCRGRGLGSQLMRAAECWAVQRGCRRMEVVTQGDNQEALALYSRLGYRVDWTQHVWHWWLA